METLSLLGIHTDAEHLVLVDMEGERYLLPINEELRSIMRTQKRRLADALTRVTNAALRPKDIQTLIRSGLSAAEVSAASGLDLDNISRYEGPVLAERKYLATQARQTQVSSEKNAPNLGDLVVDRLATRGVSPDSLVWDATRQPGDNWVIHLEFVQDAQAMEANWEFSPDTHSLLAQDEQARWLTENTAPAGAAGTNIFDRSTYFHPREAAAAPIPNSSTDSPATDPVSVTRTDSLLDELAAARGTHLSVVLDDAADEDDVAAMEAAIAAGFTEPAETPATDNNFATGFGSQRPDPNEVTPAPIVPLTRHTTADTATDTAVSSGQVPLPGFEALHEAMDSSAACPPPSEAKSSRSRGRTPMPSWDEILFGSKD